MLPENLKNEIIERLKPLKPDKIILFGSYAWGTPHKDSDIDLYIVTNDDIMPKNYDENMQNYLKISRQLRDFRKKHTTDLIVHSKQMNIKFIALKSSFSRVIFEKGIVLYEHN